MTQSRYDLCFPGAIPRPCDSTEEPPSNYSFDSSWSCDMPWLVGVFPNMTYDTGHPRPDLDCTPPPALGTYTYSPSPGAFHHDIFDHPGLSGASESVGEPEADEPLFVIVTRE